MTGQSYSAAARAVIEAHHPGARAAFLAGSLMRGEGTPTSDLDLVIIDPELEKPFRRTFDRDPIVETFVHSPESLADWFERDRASGVPSLISMVYEGLPLIPGELASKLGDRAGPIPLSEEDIASRRYAITDLLLDLEGARDAAEIRAIGAELYPALFDLHRRGRGRWSAKSKHIVRRLRRDGRKHDAKMLTAFELLFREVAVDGVISVADAVLARHGGRLVNWTQVAGS